MEHRNRRWLPDSLCPHCRDYSDPPGVWHTETLCLTLYADKHGYGFTVHASPSSIFISDIRRDSPADRCGCLQVGDRLLTLNNQSLQSTESVTQLLSECEGTHITLTVEFNVADSVVPASGIFLVKLANRGNGLGITVTASKNRLPGEALQISEIRKGSVAHRTGTLKVGDHLLAIDNQRLDHCSLEDTQHILQSSSDIVTLRIQKQETVTDTQSDSTVVYTVELEKYGGPIGITITGSEEMFEPITISGVTPGDLRSTTQHEAMYFNALTLVVVAKVCWAGRP
uniref:PDZ domain-containing protein n=1 Tax=Timema shepardi TaxID=629360 RepID=A0A7R9G3M3_TIMSH|nr:unnamed protein product [Timema shepardi]